MELVIDTLDDVLPFIAPDSGIIHSIHDGYSVINYVFTIDTTFETAIARECRGLKFDRNGKLIARPFHKFFNLGEKRLAQEEPWDADHVVMDKLDGSMVHPALVGGEIVFMTRMGMSAQSKQAWKEASSELRDFCRDMIAAGFTPIFEYTSPENRVVLAYEKPELTLLAVRDMRSGTYMPHPELEKLARECHVPLVNTFESVTDYASFWSRTRAEEDVEGYVIAFEDGHRVKVKTDAYALRHKALAGLSHEKNLLAWIATGATDDVLPLLSPEAGAFVQAYQDKVLDGVIRWAGDIEKFVSEYGHLPRKDFAMRAKQQIDPKLQAVAFGALDGNPVRDGLMEVLKRASASDKKVEAVRDLFGMEWQPIEQIE
ncbi:RNA ligase [Roseibium sp.]|uniref:RNA ligase n=1 Tax=Roseibium sp. TaxID=1936156 RepID=UPI003BAD556E